jgi:Icc-related predicted phosphoesterase
MRIAATADLHFTRGSRHSAPLLDQLHQVRDSADVMVVAGDLTGTGLPEEMTQLLNVVVRARIPTIVVLGNHDFESGNQAELTQMLVQSGIKVLDGTAYERDGVGFAGTKGFVGGFGRTLLTAFGEPEIKHFVQASVDEALKLERAMAQLRSEKRVVVLHYSPVTATVRGEPLEIYPFLGTSRLAEVVDRHGADLVLHGHAHHGQLDGKTTTGIAVHNVALNLLQAQNPPAAYRIFDV